MTGSLLFTIVGLGTVLVLKYFFKSMLYRVAFKVLNFKLFTAM